MTTELHYVDSSNVEAIGYDAEQRELHVAFIKSGTYIYLEVDEWVFQEFLQADSKGKYHHANIKDRYEFRRP